MDLVQSNLSSSDNTHVYCPRQGEARLVSLVRDYNWGSQWSTPNLYKVTSLILHSSSTVAKVTGPAPQHLKTLEGMMNGFIRPSIHPFIYQSTHSSIHPSIHPSICTLIFESLVLDNTFHFGLIMLFQTYLMSLHCKNGLVFLFFGW